MGNNMDEIDWAAAVVITLIVLMVGFGAYFIFDDVMFSRQPTYGHSCTMLSSKFNPSTQQTDLVPVFTGKGMAFGLATSGHPESLNTFWDCGDLGRWETDNRDVFRWAKPQSVLLFQNYKNQIRLVGIQP